MLAEVPTSEVAPWVYSMQLVSRRPAMAPVEAADLPKALQASQVEVEAQGY